MTKRERQDLRLMTYTEAHRVGGDPSLLLDLLADALIDEQWKSYTDDTDLPFASEYDFLTRPYPEGAGLDHDTIRILQYARHRHESDSGETKRRMTRLRDKLGGFVGQDIPEIGKQGRPRKNITRNDLSAKLRRQGNSREYKIGVLKRDAPDIAERVVNGEIKAAAGLRESRKRQGLPEESRKGVNMIDALSAFKTLKKFMSEDVLRDLTDILNDWRDSLD